MNKKISLLMLLLASSLSLASSIPPESKFLEGAKWEQMSDDEGIKTYKWDHEESGLLAFKGEALIDATPAKVATIIHNIELEKDWVPEYGDSKVVRNLTPTKRVEYVHYETPFVIKDRDFVLEAEASFDPAQKKMVFTMHSIVDANTPETDYVRGHLNYASYTLMPVDDGKKTQIVFVAHVDPKGSVAKWIINMFSKGFPEDTIEGLRKVAARADIKESKAASDLFEGRVASIDEAMKNGF